MITNIEVVNAFRNMVGDKARLSDDTGWSTRMVYYFLLRYRARLIREKVRKHLPLSHWNYQTIDCMELEKVDLDECPCTPNSGCSFMRTKLMIPKPLARLKSVTSTNGQITYTFVEWERLRHKLISRFKGEREAAYYTLKTRQDGTHLYLYNDIHKRYITVTGIFENPLEIQYFPGCDGSEIKCKKPKEQEFILDPDILTTVYDLALAQLAKSKQLGMDVTNDDLDNISINPQQRTDGRVR